LQYSKTIEIPGQEKRQVEAIQ